MASQSMAIAGFQALHDQSQHPAVYHGVHRPELSVTANVLESTGTTDELQNYGYSKMATVSSLPSSSALPAHGRSRPFDSNSPRRGLTQYDLEVIRAHQSERWKKHQSSGVFSTCVGVVIIVNVVVCWLETDWPEFTIAWYVAENLFLLFFAAEAALRMRWMSVRMYFSDKSRLFDFFLVCCGILDTWVLHFMNLDQEVRGLWRLLRLVKVLRALRLFQMFHTLVLLASGFFRAAEAVMWVGLVIFIINFSSSLMLTRLVGHQAQHWHNEDEEVACWTGECPQGQIREEILKWFGTVPDTMYTLFMCMTLANWPLVVDAASEHFPPISLFMVVYIILTTYTMVSLITATMSENMISAVRSDETRKLAEVEEEHRLFLEQLHALFMRIDQDHDGHVTKEEFIQATQDEELNLARLCGALGIGVTDGQMTIDDSELVEYFDMFTQTGEICDEKVDIEDFVSCFAQLRGAAKAKDLVKLQFDMKMLMKSRKRDHERLKRIEQQQKEILGKLNHLCAASSSHA